MKISISIRTLQLGVALATILFAPRIFAQTQDPAPQEIPLDWAVTLPLPLAVTNYPIPGTGAYFVSVAGNDSWAGNVGAPFATLAHAIQIAPPGSTIVLREGTYRQTATLVLDKPLTLQPWPGEKVWIKGSVVYPDADWIYDAAEGYWWKGNWPYVFDRNSAHPRSIEGKVNRIADWSEMVFIDGQPLWQVDYQSAIGPGKFYAHRDTQKLYLGSSPIGKLVETPAVKVLLEVKAAAASSVIRGLGFAHASPDYQGLQGKMLSILANNVLIENNTIAFSSMFGIGIPGDNAIVRGNLIAYNGLIGLTGYGPDNILIENNTFTRNNFERFAYGWEAAGIKLIRSVGMTVRDNIFNNNYAKGFWADDECANLTFVSNLVINNGNHGLKYEISNFETPNAFAIIASNVFANNDAKAIAINGSKNVRIYNNTFFNQYNEAVGVVEEEPRPVKDANGDPTGEFTPRPVSGIEIANNLFSRGRIAFLYTDDQNKLRTDLIDLLNYNGYHRLAAAPSFARWALGAASPSGENAIRYEIIKDLSPDSDDFQARTGKELQGFLIQGPNSPAPANNPFFIDTTLGDYRLKAGSAALGWGIPLPSDIAAAIGAPTDAGLDLGAIYWPPAGQGSPQQPVITSPASANGTYGVAFTYTVAAENNPISFSVSALPAGLSFNSSAGVISGTPTQTGKFTVWLGASNTAGMDTRSIEITIAAAAGSPVINSSATANGTVGIPFSYAITATNSPTSFSASGVPASLSLGTDGVISGTPTEAGNFTVGLTASNAIGTGTGSVVIAIATATQPPVITSPSTASGIYGAAFSYTIMATNSPTSFGATGLPAGLSLNTSNGVISGAPTQTGSFTVGLAASNAAGTGTGSVVITITAPPAINSPSTASGTYGATFTYAITATNNPTSFGATGLPTGLSLNSSTGIISGAPTQSGSFTVGLTATNAAGTGTGSVAITIAADTTPPSAVTNFQVVFDGSSQMTLTWTAATDYAAVAYYEIQRRSPTGGVDVVRAVPTGTSYVDPQVHPGIYYRYRIRAVDPSSNFSSYVTVTLTTPGGTGDTTAPAAPTLMQPTVSGSTVTLTWTHADPGDVAIYQVHRRVGTSGLYTLHDFVPTTSYADTSVPSGTIYYRVVAEDAAGNASVVSSVKNVTIP